MPEVRFAKSVAESMAEELRHARWKVLRKITIEEAYFLMVLRDDLLDMAQGNWLESLSNRFERGQHHLGEHLEIENPDEAQEIANEMAADLRELKNLRSDTFGEPVTEERLREAEQILARGGVKLKLVDRGMVPKDISPN
jgi:hypothetical protein